MTDGAKQIHLAVHFPGVNNTTVWSDPEAGSHIEFSSFVTLAQTAERAKFDFFFLAEGLRLREQRGRIHDLDVVGPPRHLHRAGRAGRRHRPDRPVRHHQLHLQRAVRGGPPVRLPRPPLGRPGRLERGHLVGRLHRRELPPGRVPGPGRPLRAGPRSSSRPPGELWDSWDEGAVVADPAAGRFLRRPRPGRLRAPRPALRHRRAVRRAPLAAGPPGHLPGRGLRRPAGSSPPPPSDCIFSRHGTLEAGQRFYQDVKGRLARYGRSPDELKILPAATFVLGDTEADAIERAAVIRRQQVSGQTAILFLEQVWNRDLSDLRPRRPAARPSTRTSSAAVHHPGPGQRLPPTGMQTAREWRALAEAKKLSIRELMIEVTGRPSFVGTAEQVADADRHGSCRPTRPTGSSWCPTSPRAGSTSSPTRSCPSSRSGAASATEYAGTDAARPPRACPPRPAGVGPEPRVGADAMTAHAGAARRARPGAGRVRVRRRRRRCATPSTWRSAAEAFGYRRYWFAEHHLNPGVAGSSPAVLIALVAGATERIRLGSGGVQSGHRTALSVVEEFGLLDALHPGPDRPRDRAARGAATSCGTGAAGLDRRLRRAVAGRRQRGPPDRQRAADPGPALAPAAWPGSPRLALTADLLQQAGRRVGRLRRPARRHRRPAPGHLPLGRRARPASGPRAGAPTSRSGCSGSSAGESAVGGRRARPALRRQLPRQPGHGPRGRRRLPGRLRAVGRPRPALRGRLGRRGGGARRRDGAPSWPTGFALWVRSIRRGEGAIPFPTPEEARRPPVDRRGPGARARTGSTPSSSGPRTRWRPGSSSSRRPPTPTS